MPDSRFVRELIAARTEPLKRHVLFNTQYTVHHLNGASQKTILEKRDDWIETLHTVFGICTDDIPNLTVKLDGIIKANRPS